MLCFTRRSLPVWLLASCAVLAVPIGCSFDFTEAPTGTGAGGGGGDADDACPMSAPTDGADCTGDAICEYGDDARLDCRQELRCIAGKWEQFKPTCPCSPASNPSLDCPADADGPAPECFGEEVLLCTFADGGHCGCGGEEGGWTCPPVPPDCPTAAPNLGASCDSDGKVCEYGDCVLGTRIVRKCAGGTWVEQPPDCMNATICPHE